MRQRSMNAAVERRRRAPTMHAPPGDIAQLPSAAVVRFVGDLHLGDGAHNDTFGKGDERLVAFLEDCRRSCDALVFMGDTYDVPQAFTLARVIGAHAPATSAIRELARHIDVVFVRGNHDWHVDYEAAFPGARAVHRMTLGDALVMHGHQLDRYCDPERRLHRLEIALHHLAERILGFHFRVPLFAHDSVRNRVGHWLGNQYGRHLRRMARVYRLVRDEARAHECEAFIHYWSRSVWGDPQAMFSPVQKFLERGQHSALVCGHTHLPGVVALGDRTYVNTGSWTFRASEYAVWDGRTFRVEDFGSRKVHADDHYRWMIEGHDPGDFFEWWRQHYRGWLRFEAPDGR